MNIIDEWDVAEQDRDADIEKWGIRVCPECYGELVGHWGEGWPVQTKGAVCWRFHKIDGEGLLVEWPRELTCRECKKVETREEVRKYYITPYHLNAKEKTHTCRCVTPDSSD
jgi:hypothetical protein